MIAILEVVSRLQIVDPRFLPPFSEVLLNAVLILGQPQFLLAVGFTLWAWLISMIITVVIGATLGTALGLSDLAYRLARTVLDLLRPIPAIVAIPLVLLVVGRGLGTIVTIAVFGAIWPVLFNTIAGVHDVDPQTKQMGRIFGLSKPAIIGRIVLPSAAPVMAVGIRLASSIALATVVTVELIAGGEGLGAYIGTIGASGTNVVLVYSAIVVAGVLGLALNLAIRAVEQRLFAWRRWNGEAS